MGSVRVAGVGKRYRLRRHGADAKGHTNVGGRLAANGRDFWGVRDISFELHDGEMLGVVGPNGAGKSTLLRLIGGVGRPTEGKIRTQGRIGGLLELGSDFHPELTGRENVSLGGIIAGLSRGEVNHRMEEIIDFAEIADFIDSPVRTYSSGMLLRLAFSIIVNSEPDILLIDEVLAVGDAAFRGKCLSRIEQLRRRGCAIMVVTHDTRMAAQMCTEVLWLNKGHGVQIGPAESVVAAYVESMDWETRRRTPENWSAETTAAGTELRMLENRFGSMELRVTDVRLVDERGRDCHHLHRGAPLRVEIDYTSDQRLLAPNFGVIIRQNNNTVLFDETVRGAQFGLETVFGSGSVALNFDRLDLNGGEYLIDVGVYSHDWAYAYDYHWRAYSLTVVSPDEVKGAVNPPHEWEKAQPKARAV